MAKTKKTKSSSTDLSALINQSAADKLLNSVSFPLTIVNVTTPPPGNLLSKNSTNSDEVFFPEKTVIALLKQISDSANSTSTQTPSQDKKFYSEALSNLSTTIESAKAYLDAKSEAKRKKEPFSGEFDDFANSILEDGITGLYKTKGIEFRAICSKLQVVADNKPNLTLNGTRVGISNSKITTNATGELWWYHPTLHCRRWCTQWSVTWSWDRVASVSVSIRVDLDGYIQVSVNGKVLNANLHINKLRLDYPILREIPLEGLANRVLANKQIPIFDAGSFVASIPIINSRFAIDSIGIPNNNGSIEIDIAIKQV